ncbi:MAG: transcriptional repressor [Thermoleophilia bacterium]|nr:transcriptional repressor [Thermoleophilia bacterium]
MDHARTELARAGHRAGGARTAVLEQLAGAGCCQTAQEIHDLLRGTDRRRVGIASVYRVLDQLVGLHLVTKIEFGDGVSRFEAAQPGGHHHHHVVCTGCGRVDPFEDRDLERAIAGSGRRTGFEVTDHDVVLRGRCPDCAGSRGAGEVSPPG